MKKAERDAFQRVVKKLANRAECLDDADRAALAGCIDRAIAGLEHLGKMEVARRKAIGKLRQTFPADERSALLIREVCEILEDAE
jgi:hypothetical protein